MAEQFVSSDFLKVLLALKSNVMKDLHVATLGCVEEINDNVYKCRVFPFSKDEQEKDIECRRLSSVSPVVGSYVLILFLDRDFIQNLKQINSSQPLTPIKDTTELHSERYGIIIGLVV